MTESNFPQPTQNASQKFEIQAYKTPKDVHVLRKTHVCFSGSPKRHPDDADKIILVADPYSAGTVYYEFNRKDISYAEELPSLVTPEGDSMTMVRIWVKKMAVGIRCSPFIVEDTRR